MYKYFTLKNGLNVFLVPTDSESVVFSIYVKTGSRYELPRIGGIAHFLEHVFFKGSQNHPKPTDISGLIDGIGGDFNASTSKEITEFYIKAEKHHFDLIFEVLTDMIQNPLFNEQEIEKEKGVVIEEINLYQDNPSAQVESELEKIMWPKSQLGREVIGTKETVMSLDQAGLFSFKQSFYVPQNMILGIAGNFDQQKVMRHIRGSWGKLDARGVVKNMGAPAVARSKTVPKFAKADDKQAGPRLLIQNKPTQQAHLALGFKSYGFGNKKNPAVTLLASILGGSMSSRLFVNIREQKGLAYYIRATNGLYLDTGNFTIHAGLKISSTLQALRAVLEEIRRVRTELIRAPEIKKSIDYIKGRVVLALEDNQERLNWIAERYAFTGKIELPKQFFARLARVTAPELRAVANQIFTDQRMSMALIGPFKNHREFEKEFHLKSTY